MQTVRSQLFEGITNEECARVTAKTNHLSGMCGVMMRTSIPLFAARMSAVCLA